MQRLLHEMSSRTRIHILGQLICDGFVHTNRGLREQTHGLPEQLSVPLKPV